MTIILYSLCAAEFFIRYFKKRPVRLYTGDVTRGIFDRYLKCMSLALAFNTTCLFIRYVRICYYDSSDHQSHAFLRAVYRTIELSDGWTGRIIATQVYFSASFFPLPFPSFNLLFRCFGRSNDRFGDLHPELCPSRCFTCSETFIEVIQ